MLLMNIILLLRFQSPLPTRGSDAYMINTRTIMAISIHAPHEGERLLSLLLSVLMLKISIHAPHEGERRYWRK